MTGIIRNALVKYGFESFTLVLFIIPNVSKEEILQLEQRILDRWSPEYNIQPNATSSAGRILSVEHKIKISTSLKGEKSPRFNKGTPVYLYEVHSTKLELSATFPNRFRAAAMLDIPASTLFNYIKNKTLFQIKGLSYILSKDCSLNKISD